MKFSLFRSKSVDAVQLPPTITKVAAPDPSPLVQQEFNRLPGSWKVLPIAFYVALAVMVGLFIRSTSIAATNASIVQELNRKMRQIESDLVDCATQTAVVKKQTDLAKGIAAWTSSGLMLQPLIIKIAKVFDGRAQINELSIVREDPKVLRYTLFVTCIGDPHNFEPIDKALNSVLASDGWQIIPTLNASEGARWSTQLYLVRDDSSAIPVTLSK